MKIAILLVRVLIRSEPMTTAVATVIVGILSLFGTALGSFGGFKLMSYRLEQLEKKVEKHNNFAERVPILEEQIRVANHRIADNEKVIEQIRSKGAST